MESIRFSTVNLVLRTQAGEYRIDQIAELPGVGTVWFYPKGVANILSQYRMVVNSGWDVDYSTKLYRKSGNMKDLKYDCFTSEGVNVTFTPNKQGLHVLDSRKYFGLGKYGCVFGETIIDNNTNNELYMRHNIILTYIHPF